MNQPTLLKQDFKIKYGTPQKVTVSQYNACLAEEYEGICKGELINGEYYITLLNNRYKFVIELVLNTTV